MRASSINFNESLELWNNVSVKIPSIEHAQQIFDIVRKAWLDTYPNDEYWITRNDIEKKFVDKCERIKQAIEWYNNEGSRVLESKKKLIILGHDYEKPL